MMMYDVQIDVERWKLAPYTDPLKRPKNRKCIYKTVNAFTVPRLKQQIATLYYSGAAAFRDTVKVSGYFTSGGLATW